MKRFTLIWLTCFAVGCGGGDKGKKGDDKDAQVKCPTDGYTRCDDGTHQTCTDGVWVDTPCGADDTCVTASADLAVCEGPDAPKAKGQACANTDECQAGLECQSIPNQSGGSVCTEPCDPSAAGACGGGQLCVQIDSAGTSGVCLAGPASVLYEGCVGIGQGNCNDGLECLNLGVGSMCLTPCTPGGGECSGDKCTQMTADIYICSGLPPAQEMDPCFGINEGSCTTGLTCAVDGAGDQQCVQGCTVGNDGPCGTDRYCDGFLDASAPTAGGCFNIAGTGEDCVSNASCFELDDTCVDLGLRNVCSRECTPPGELDPDPCGDEDNLYCSELFGDWAEDFNDGACVKRPVTGELCLEDGFCREGGDECMVSGFVTFEDRTGNPAQAAWPTCQRPCWGEVGTAAEATCEDRGVCLDASPFSWNFEMAGDDRVLCPTGDECGADFECLQVRIQGSLTMACVRPYAVCAEPLPLQPPLLIAAGTPESQVQEMWFDRLFATDPEDMCNLPGNQDGLTTKFCGIYDAGENPATVWCEILDIGLPGFCVSRCDDPDGDLSCGPTHDCVVSPGNFYVEEADDMGSPIDCFELGDAPCSASATCIDWGMDQFGNPDHTCAYPIKHCDVAL